jgi:hypothetical protein
MRYVCLTALALIGKVVLVDPDDNAVAATIGAVATPDRK